MHKASLEVASAGIYTEEQVAGISPERLERFFTLKPNGYQISQALRESIVFAPHNLIRDAPFTKLDLITCRNLLIYFQPHAQKTVLTLFHFALKPGGFLFLGSSESPGGLLDEFDTIDEHAKIYRKRRDIGLPRDLKLPLPRSGHTAALGPPAAAAHAGVNPQLLARLRPAARSVHAAELPGRRARPAGRHLRRRRDAAARSRRGGRRRTCSTCSATSCGRSSPARCTACAATRERPLPGRARCRATADRYSLVAEPLRDAHGALTHVLISLDRGDGAEHPGRAGAAVRRRPGVGACAASATPLRGLSREQHAGARGRARLHQGEPAGAIQELETANEELQATNEELIASNEELQSTNEELHSVNEELYTVNAEYQKKNAELQELNDDIEHLLNGTDVATMFLDRQLCIRKFTPRIAETFRVIPQDIGRPLAHLHARPRAPDADGRHRARARRTACTVEAQTWDKRQRCYFLRILPYRARSRERGRRPFGVRCDRPLAPDGVVLTLTDISALEQARARLAQLSAIVESSDDAIIGKTLDGIDHELEQRRARGSTATPPRRRSAGTPASSIRRGARRRSMPSSGRSATGGPVERLETQRLRKDGSLVDVSVTFSPILDSADAIVGVSGISRDITQLVRARQEIAEREERIRLLLDSTAEAIYGIDLSGVCIFCNAACARLLGYDSPAALIGKQMHPLIHHTRPDGTPYPPEQSPIYEAMRHREAAHVDDEVLWRADGTSFPAEYLEPPDRPERRGHRRGRHVPRHHRAPARRAGDPGRRAAARAVPGDAVARAAQSAGRHPERDPPARQRERGPTARARRPARSSSGRPTTWRGCWTTCSTSRASRAAASCCATRSSTCATRRGRRSRRSGRSWPSTRRSSTVDIAGRAGARHRRSGAAAADPGQPAQQRLEVLAARRARAVRACAARATRP